MGAHTRRLGRKETIGGDGSEEAVTVLRHMLRVAGVEWAGAGQRESRPEEGKTLRPASFTAHLIR